MLEGYAKSELDAMPDRIAESFRGLKVFLTGGTGFVGKVLIEKILRMCPDIGQIFLLVRQKKGKTPKQRMEETLNDVLFDKVRNMRGGVAPLLEKMTLISGDVGEPDLGFSDDDRQKILDEEPIPGWADSINGPFGLLIGAGKGVIRSMYCKSNSYADYLPADVFINSIMVSVWYGLTHSINEFNFINVTSSAEIKITWAEVIEIGRDTVSNKVPLNGVAWYPGGSMKHSRLYHYICMVLFHWIPAILVDILLFCLGYQPVLVRVQRRIWKGFEVFEYYTNNQWYFQSVNIQSFRKMLNARERLDYRIDGADINISAYFEHSILGARRYILNQSDDTIPAAKRHMTVMWVVDIVFRFTFWALMLYWLSGYISPLFSSSAESSQPMLLSPLNLTSLA